MPRHSSSESSRLIEALEMFWSPRRSDAGLQVKPGNGRSQLRIATNDASEARPWSARRDDAGDAPFKVR
jgi:hypothetical protein